MLFNLAIQTYLGLPKSQKKSFSNLDMFKNFPGEDPWTPLSLGGNNDCRGPRKYSFPTERGHRLSGDMEYHPEEIGGPRAHPQKILWEFFVIAILIGPVY